MSKSMVEQMEELKEAKITLSASVEELTAQVTALEAEKEALTEQHASVLVAHADELDAIKATHEADMSAVVAENSELEVANETLASERDVLQAEIDAAKAALAAPEFRDIAGAGEKDPLDEGSMGNEAVDGKYAEYQAIENPRAKSKFWAENEAAIQADMKAIRERENS